MTAVSKTLNKFGFLLIKKIDQIPNCKRSNSIK